MATADPTAKGSPQNSVGQSKNRQREAAGAAASAADKSPPARAVPEEVRRRFLEVNNRYYFPDGARAFTDRGTRLTTLSENTEVVRSLIQIAEARGWTEVTVRGTPRFRKEAWVAARMAGLEVRGYRPSEFEQAQLARTLGRQAPAPVEDSVTAGDGPLPAPAEVSGRDARSVPFAGRLIDHGRATYRHDPRASMSYFVKLETRHADRTIWGVDLERAVKESLTQPQVGDEVILRAVRQDAVKVRTQRRDADGELIERELDTLRNRWIIEKRDFLEERARAARTVRDTSVDPKNAVKAHPELVGTYLAVHAAKLAAKRFRNPEDQERFVATVRSALADAIARGEPLPAVRLRERAATRDVKSPEREPEPVR